MTFDIIFDKTIADIPIGGVFLLERDGDVYERISDSSGWYGLYRNLRKGYLHATDFPDKTLKVHRIYHGVEGMELHFLAGWYAGRYYEMKQRAQLEAHK